MPFYFSTNMFSLDIQRRGGYITPLLLMELMTRNSQLWVKIELGQS